MGDRFDRLGVRHVNVEALLRRPGGLPGIGHNNGPTFDMSWEAWVWRRAAAKAWKTPSPEVARLRLRRAERLGITYRELTAAQMDTGAYLGAAILPLSLAARLRRGAQGTPLVEPRPALAQRVGRFGGRLFLLADIDAVPSLAAGERDALLELLNGAFAGKVEALGWGHDGDAVRRLLRAHALPRQEVFLVGAGMAHRILGEAAGLPLIKDVEDWCMPG